jgi:hypothetical protein
VDRWRALQASGDQAAIAAELQGVLDRSMSYNDRLQQSMPKTPEERALATLYPNNPRAQAEGLIAMKSQPTYTSTPGGVIYRPGFQDRMGGPAQAAPQMPMAGEAPGAPRSLPGGGTLIPTEKPPAQMTPTNRIRIADEIKASEQKIRETETLLPLIDEHISAIDKGIVDFGPYNNTSYEAQLSGFKVGEATAGAKAYGNLKYFLNEIISGKLRLNVGVQTESDAKRAAREIIDNLGETSFVRERLDYMKRRFADDVNGQRRELQRFIENTGFEDGGPGAPMMEEPASQPQRPTERFAPLPGETETTRPQPYEQSSNPSQPWTYSNVPKRASAPAMSYTAAKAGTPPPGGLISGLDRARVEDYARRYGLSVREAEQILMEKQRKRDGRPAE